MAKANPCRGVRVAFSAACILCAVHALPAQGSQVKDAPSAPAQEAAPQLPVFEVVSIKPHPDEGIGHMNSDIWMTPDGITISGVPLSMLVREAFGVSDDRVLNEPDWVKVRRFDIQAKVGPDDVAKLEAIKPPQRWAMLLPVFEDRFGLKFHHEVVDLEAYTLMVAKGGAKIKAAKPVDGEDAPVPRFSTRRSAQGMTMECHGATMADLARTISQQLGATVVDRTELKGNYDFTLAWAPDEGGGPTMTGSLPMAMRMPAAGVPPDSSAPPEASGPSVFTALEEQLGLKLEARKQPVDAIVIDHIEQPSPN